MRTLSAAIAAIMVVFASPAAAADAAQAARARACGIDAAAVERSIAIEPTLKTFDAKVRSASRGTGGFRVLDFSDYSCPNCQAWNVTLKDFAAKHADVRISTVEYPIYGKTLVSRATGNQTLNGSRLGLAALAKGDAPYFKFHDSLMAERGGVRWPAIERAAAAAGLNFAALKAAADTPAITAQIEANTAFAKALGYRGTPIIVADGVVLGWEGRNEALACLLSEWRKAKAA